MYVRIVMKRGWEKREIVGPWGANVALPRKDEEIKVAGDPLPYYIVSAKEVEKPLFMDFSGARIRGIGR